MKRKDIWKELNLPPPSKKTTRTSPSLQARPDPVRQEAAQQVLRLNCTKTLQFALFTKSTDDQQESPGGPNADPGTAASVAEDIERALFLHHQSNAGQEYKMAARTLVASLKRNAELRQQVLTGDLTPSQLVVMDARELATQQQREEFARLQEQGTRRVTLAGHGSVALGIATAEYQCGSCGGRSCDYFDSGRRDIGKCETWGSKDGQGCNRIVTCLGCGNRWEVDDV